MMRQRALLATVSFAAALLGCSREEALSCESRERYSTAVSVQPVQIPDDLSPPDESGALRLPPDVAGNRTASTQACLESPPSFRGDQRPGRSGRPVNAEPPPAEAPEPNPERAIDN